MKRLLVASVVLGWATSGGGAAPAAVFHSGEGDVDRVRRHLTQVERELRQADVSHLTPSQRAARAVHLDRLAEYRMAGRYPHNHDDPTRRLPAFRDAHGTMCAMAALIASSGHEAVVDLVSSTQNNATVTELARDPALGPKLGEWLAGAGLSVREAQRVQPTYGGEDGEFPVDDAVPADATEDYRGLYAAGSIAGTLVNAITVYHADNPRRDKRWLARTGTVLGLGQLSAGLAVIGSQDGVVQGLGIANTMIGGVTIVTNVAALVATGREATRTSAPPHGLRAVPAVGFGEAGPMLAVDVSFD